jgi:hypothetical protein
MRIYVDLDSEKCVTAPGISQEVTTLSFKRSAQAKVEVQFCRSGLVVELASTATGVFEFKETGKYDQAPVTGALAWVKTGSGSAAVYTFLFSFIPALDALFFVDGNETNDVAELPLMAELQWSVDGNVAKTPTLAATIFNDVVRDGDVVPEMPPIAYGVYLLLITSLTGGVIGEDPITHLPAVPTLNLLVGYIIQLLLPVGGDRVWNPAVLRDGPADGGDPAQVAPLDYDVDDNDKHWQVASGPAGADLVSTNNFSVAAQTPAAATRTYIAGSKITVPGNLQIGTIFRWKLNLRKTAAGVAPSTFDVAVGTNGTTADTARLSFTKPAGTAAADEGFVTIEAIVRGPLSISGIMVGELVMMHNGNTVGHMVIPVAVVNVVSGAFDVTPAGLFVGLCLTSGAADAITIEQVTAEALNV